MQVIGAHTLRKAGPSISNSTISAPLEAAQDVAVEHSEGSKKTSVTSCEHVSLTHSSKKIRSPASSLDQSGKMINTIKSDIDAFIANIETEGFVLEKGRSKVAARDTELGNREHILSPIPKSKECPGGLTFNLPPGPAPVINRETKPLLEKVSEEVKVPAVPAKSAERRKPSVAWSRLGSRGFHFVDDGRSVWK